jgi:anaerobic selenocysteine-containing dehydrogenase
MVGHYDWMQDVTTWKNEWMHHVEELRIEGLAKAWDRDPEALHQELLENGFVTLSQKRYGHTPYNRPFASPSGRLEVYAFRPVLRGYREHGFATYFDPPAYTMPRAADEFFLVNGKSPIGGSGVSGLAFPTQYLVDNRLWMNPADADRLGISMDDEVEVEGLDTGWKAKVNVNVTPRVIAGTAFVYSYSGGHRQKVVADDPRFAKLAKGLAPHWFSTSRVDPVTGSNFNNASVRIRRA